MGAPSLDRAGFGPSCSDYPGRSGWEIQKINLLFIGRGAVNLSWIRIEPESRLYEMAIDEGFISKRNRTIAYGREGIVRYFLQLPHYKKICRPSF